MAMMHPARCAGDERDVASACSPLNGPVSPRPRLFTVSAVAAMMALGGCAREPSHREFNSSQREVRTSHVRPTLHARIRVKPQQQPQAELRVHRPDPALLAPQPAPDCEFKRSDVKAVDPNEWGRLKTEYERQCYQDAEKAARDRLKQLQASSLCEVERIPQNRPHRRYRTAIRTPKN